MRSMPPAGVKGAEGGRDASRAFTLDARVPGGRSPPDKPAANSKHGVRRDHFSLWSKATRIAFIRPEAIAYSIA